MEKARFGFIYGGESALSTFSKVNQRFDDIGNAYTGRQDDLTKASICGCSAGRYGFVIGGYDGAVRTDARRFCDIGNVWVARATASHIDKPNVHEFSLRGFPISYSSRLCDVANTWTSRTTLPQPRNSLASCAIRGFGFAAAGYDGSARGYTHRFDEIANEWTSRTAVTSRANVRGFSVGGYGFVSGSGGTVDRICDVTDTRTTRATTTDRPDPATFAVRGHGFTVGSRWPTYSGVNQRLDDIANVQTTRESATTRGAAAGWSV